MKKGIFALLFLFSATFSLASCGESYTVTWENYDGTVLEIDKDVARGTIPKYDGKIPTRPADEQYTYTFSGWDKDITKGVEDNITFTAQYSSVKNDYTVTFDGKGGTLVSGTEVQKVKSPSEIVPPVYEKEDYDFTGWDKDIATITTSTTIYAQWKYSPSDDTSLEIDGFTKEGEKLSKKTDNKIVTFSFSNIVHVGKGATWKLYSDIRGQEEIITKTIDLNVGDNTVYINVTARSGRNELYTIVVRRLDMFTISWVDEDGTTPLSTTYVQEDDMPEYDKGTPTKPKDAQYTYTFAGWVPSIVKASSNTTYKASYSSAINKYTVIWKNYNGAVLETDENVPYGTIPSYDGKTPDKPADAQYTYKFDGWDKDTKKGIEGDTVFTAQFSNTINTYTITWKNYDGSTLSSEDYDYGATPSYKGETPTKPADAQYTYTFAGWSPTIVAVTGAATYTATYTNTTNRYTITWKNYDGSTISSEDYDYGATPSYKGETPTKPATIEETFTFSGWSPSIVEVTGAATYTATYNPSVRKYTITWKNYDGSTISSEDVEYGATPSYKGETPFKPADAQYTYTFAGWSPAIATVTGAATYTATYTNTTNKYTIYWYNGATLLHSEELEYGRMPTYHWTDKPSKEQTQRIKYDWNGWEETITTVTGNAEYHAHFDEVDKYLITYKNYDGTVLQQSYVPSNILPTYEGAQPTRPSDAQYTYEPVGWDKDEVKPTCDTVYIYTYQPVVNKYKITWMGGINGDQLLDEKMVAYGLMPTAPTNVPETITEGIYVYTFYSWSPVVTKVTGEATYVAQYKQELVKFNITWKNYDDTVLGNASVPYGTIPSYSGTPTKVINSHSFEWLGWDKEVLPATQDETYKAVFDNDITFDFDGTNCTINGKTEFTDVYEFDESTEPALINYIIKPIYTYTLPDTISVYVDNNLVTSGYSYDKSTGAFSIASNLGNIRLEVTGVQL